MQRSKEIVKISFGAAALNELLGGGLESKCITEMFGEYRPAATHVTAALDKACKPAASWH